MFCCVFAVLCFHVLTMFQIVAPQVLVRAYLLHPQPAIWAAMVASSETNVIASSCEYDRHRIEQQTVGPKASWIYLPQNSKPCANKSRTRGHGIPYTFSPLPLPLASVVGPLCAVTKWRPCSRCDEHGDSLLQMFNTSGALLQILVFFL
jgi:hypothetical protein